MPPKEQESRTCTIPLCTSWIRGRGGITPINSKSYHPDPDHSDLIKEGDLNLGETVPEETVSTENYDP